MIKNTNQTNHQINPILKKDVGKRADIKIKTLKKDSEPERSRINQGTKKDTLSKKRNRLEMQNYTKKPEPLEHLLSGTPDRKAFYDSVIFEWIDRDWFVETNDPFTKPREIINTKSCIETLKQCRVALKQQCLKENIRYGTLHNNYYVTIPRNSNLITQEFIKGFTQKEKSLIISYGVFLLVWRLYIVTALEKTTRTHIRDLAYKKKNDCIRNAAELNILLRDYEETMFLGLLLFFSAEAYNAFEETLQQLRKSFFTKKYRKQPFPKELRESLGYKKLQEVFVIFTSEQGTTQVRFRNPADEKKR